MWEIVMQVVSILGAGMILAAFLSLQRKWLRSDSAPYLWLNLAGAALLVAVAVWDRRVGFVILEAVWAAVSLWALVRGRGDRPQLSP